jgi:hypothetical protein
VVTHRVTTARPRHVDICDEAFVPTTLQRRPIASPPPDSPALNICDEAFAWDPVSTVAHRATSTRPRHVDICDEASVPNPVQLRPIASPPPDSPALTSAMKHSRGTRCRRGSSRHFDQPRHVDICDEASVREPFALLLIASQGPPQLVGNCDLDWWLRHRPANQAKTRLRLWVRVFTN